MIEAGFWIRFALAVLATWRVTHLLAGEDGPADLIARFRAWLGSGLFGKLMDCFNCLSLWVAAPLAFFVCRKPVDVLVTWLALSGAACLLQRLGQDPVVFHTLPEKPQGDENRGMLWRETRDDAERSGAGPSP
ncbi:MAG: DUF1360 domain-containing protein [Acidobacteria bacterium]|nr:DUF1360 domain-containing protein [Acidobacteriota bacterium]